MARGALGLVLVSAALATVCAFFLGRWDGAQALGSPAPAVGRIISLTPAISETLFAIGAGSQVVGVSDYCDYPPDAAKLPRIGTTLGPNYERIAGLAPTLILGEQGSGAKLAMLDGIAPTRLIPWLTVPEVTQGIRTTGRLGGHPEAAEALAQQIEKRLARAPSASAPRILALIGGSMGSTSSLWFIRRNSLHGAVLEASGARNAIPEEVQGPPSLSLERLIAIDPEGLIILTQGREVHERLESELQRVTVLSAVKKHKIRTLRSDAAFSVGPRILELADQLESVIKTLQESS